MAKLERVERRIDGLTGDVLSEERNVISLRPLPEEPAYVKMYVQDLGRVLNLQESHRDILLYVAAASNYYGIIALSSTTKARIAATVKCARKTVDNAIHAYLQTGILRRVGRGEYELDPHLFARGAWAEIRERRASFALTIDYSEKKGRQLRMRRMSPEEEVQRANESAGQLRLVE